MAPVYKIALVQLHPRVANSYPFRYKARPNNSPQPLQPDKNFAKAAEFIVSAAQKGAQLAVLPEYHLTNWIPEDPRFFSLCAQWETYLNKYKALAKEHKICIVPGTICETFTHEEKGEDQLHNVSYFIDDKGEVLGRYQKKNLWYSMSISSSHQILTFPCFVHNKIAEPLSHLRCEGIQNGPT